MHPFCDGNRKISKVLFVNDETMELTEKSRSIKIIKSTER